MALGDCAGVLTLTQEDGGDGSRLLRGMCLADADPTAADAALGALQTGVAGDYGRLVHAKVLLKLNRPEDALRRTDGLQLPGAAGLQLRLVRGEALIQAGRSLDARADLQALLETPVTDEARSLLARGAWLRGDGPAAIAAWRRLWVSSARGGWHDAAEQELKARDAIPTPSRADDRPLIRERIDALRAANRHAEATTLLLALREADATAATAGQVARALFEARRYAEAAAAWDQLHTDDAAIQVQDLYEHALAFIRSGQPDKGQAVWKRLQVRFPGSKQADEASYKTAWLLVDAGLCADAIPALEDHLRRWPSTAWYETAMWFIGRCQWKLGLRSEALESWTTLLRARPSTSLAPSIAYWSAIAVDDEAARAAALQRVIDRWPATSQAWFASERLGRRIAPRALVHPPMPASLAERTATVRASWLGRHGLLGWGRDEAGPLGSVVRGDRTQSLALADLLLFLGDARAARRLLDPWCPSPAADDADPALLQACHPRLMDEIVRPAAEAWSLPRDLPFAIMMAESNMDPSVSSAAGARGLMQIMPAEGPRLHQAATAAGLFEADRLYVAPYNALLGTTELGLKRRSLSGVLAPDSTPAVIASYNAGEEAVRRWFSPGGPVAFDEFAEDIPYAETRKYVRNVLGFLMSWRLVYGDPIPPGPSPPALPER